MANARLGRPNRRSHRRGFGAGFRGGDGGLDIGLTGAAPWTVNLTGPLPILDSDINIEGPGADRFTVRRDTGGDYRIFTVAGDSEVSVSGITVSKRRECEPGWRHLEHRG